jgi:hypothetical protein
VRFVLQAPWPDFLPVYSALVSGAGLILPMAYTEQVGEAGFQQHPIGLGPYRFVRATTGTELVLDASSRYWRKTPAIRRLIFKSVPDPTTQLAVPKTGELDIAYNADDWELACRGNLRFGPLLGRTRYSRDVLTDWVSGSNATKTYGKAPCKGEIFPTTRLFGKVRCRNSMHGKNLYSVLPCKPRIFFRKVIDNISASI